MTATELLAFLATAAVVIVTPGQDTALTIRNTLAGGRRNGIATALGVGGGQAIWALATSAGLAAVVVASERVFLALKLAGAAYLVLLGAQALVRAARGSGARIALQAGAGSRHRIRRGFREGLVSNLANPKMAVFFTSLLPQFAGSGGAFWTLLALGAGFCAMTVAWLSAYAVAVNRLSAVLRRPWLARAIDAATGAVLIALGGRVAAEARR